MEPSEREKNPQTPRSYELINSEQAEEYRRKAQESVGFDLSQVKFLFAKPGDELFDRAEAEAQLFQRNHTETDIQKVLALQGEEFKKAAQEMGVKFDGILPGFVSTRMDRERLLSLLSQKKMLRKWLKNMLRELEKRGGSKL